jgi:hypothetical protein
MPNPFLKSPAFLLKDLDAFNGPRISGFLGLATLGPLPNAQWVKFANVKDL